MKVDMTKCLQKRCSERVREGESVNEQWKERRGGSEGILRQSREFQMGKTSE